MRGLLALAFGHAQDAQRWVERAIAIQPEPILYNTLYAIRLKLEDFAGAMQSIRQGLALQPDFAALHYNLALTLQHLDQLEEAALGYRRTLELDPDNSAAHNNFGRVCADLGEMDEAERHYRRAIELAPVNLVARNNLAMALLATGRYEEAWPYFEDRWVSFKLADGRRAPAPVEVPLPRWPGADVSLNAGSDTHVTRASAEVFWCSMSKASATACTSCAICRWRSSVSLGSAMSARRLYADSYEQSLCSRWPGLVLLDSRAGRSVQTGTGTLSADVLADGIQTQYRHHSGCTPVSICRYRASLPLARAARRPLPEPICRVWAWFGREAIRALLRQSRSLSLAQIAPLLALQHVRWISLQKTDDAAKLPDAATRRSCSTGPTNSPTSRIPRR